MAAALKPTPVYHGVECELSSHLPILYNLHQSDKCNPVSAFMAMMAKFSKLRSLVSRQVTRASTGTIGSEMASNNPTPSPWDAHAAVYEEIWERSTSLWGFNALVLGQLPSSSSTMRLLDVACGSGSLALAAAARGLDVTATDLSPGMVARLQTKLATSAVSHKITSRVVDGQTLEGLKDGSFDIVSSNFGIFLFPDRDAAWRSALRVLAPGGRLLATSWDANSVNARMIHYVMTNAQDEDSVVQEMTEQSKDAPAINRTLAAMSFQEELEETGFQDVAVYTVTNAMCFQSGEELVRGVVDNTNFISMTAHKNPVSVQRCLLDFSQLVLDGVDPFGEDVASKAAAFCNGDVKAHPLWRKPFALHATAHIAVATKPAEYKA